MADRHRDEGPLVDLIFPNREQPSLREPTGNHRSVGRVAKILGQGKRKKVRIAAGPRDIRLADKPVRRRRVLLGIGTGVAVASGAGTAAAWLTGAIGAPGSAKQWPDTSQGLGAAG